MARDKKNNKKPNDKKKSSKKDSGTSLSQEGKATEQMLNEAGRVYTNNPNLNIPLERLDPNSTSSAETNSLINTVQDSLNPNSPNYAGAISPQLQDALNKLQAGIAITPEEREQLNLLKQAQERTSDTADVLQRLKGGLEGLNAAENTALRDKATQAAQSGLATSIRSIQSAAARSGARNAFAGGAINKATDSFQRQRLADEQEQMIANIDIQDRRRGQYADAVGSAENREAGRRMDYTNSLQNSNQNQFNRQGIYTNTLGGTENDSKNRVAGTTNTLGSLLQTRDTARNGANEFNIGQGNKEAAARAAGTTGIAQLSQDKKYSDQMIKIAKGGTSSGKRKSGDGRDRSKLLGQVASDPGQSYLDNTKKLIDDHFR
jgi:hypothetical protein